MNGKISQEYSMPVLSIIVPHKDSSDKLRRLLGTIPSESWLEIIIVDDRSKLNHIAKRITSRHPQARFVNNQCQSSNAGTARNTGITISRGEWLLFADADDLFHHGAFYTIQELIQKADGIDCIYFKVSSFCSDDGPQPTRHTHYNFMVDEFLGSGDQSGLRFDWPVPWGRLIRRSLVEENKLTFSDRVAANDVVFAMRLGVYARRLTAVSRELYCVEKSSVSITSSLTSAKALARLQSLIERNEILVSQGYEELVHFGLRYFLKSTPLIWHRESRTVLFQYFQSSFALYPRIMHAKIKKCILHHIKVGRYS